MFRRFETAARTERRQEGQFNVIRPYSAAGIFKPHTQGIPPILSEKILDFSLLEWEMQPSRTASPSSR